MGNVTVFSVLDGKDYRRLETLSEPEAEQFLWALKKRDALAVIVKTVRAPKDWTAEVRDAA